MNWFKKSIAYDQRRHIQWIAALLFIPVLLSILDFSNIIPNYERSGATGYFNMSIIVAGVIAIGGLVVVASIGIRSKAEIDFIPSMPMSKRDVLFTKIACSLVAILIPLMLGFLITSLIYFVNQSSYIELGHTYDKVFYQYMSLFAQSIMMVLFIFLCSLIYNNVKIPLVLGPLALISYLYIWSDIRRCITGGMGRGLYFPGSGYVDGAFNAMTGTSTEIYSLYPHMRGLILIIIGVCVLLYTIIEFVVNKYENDIYVSAFPFKVSKVFAFIGIYLVIFAIISFVAKISSNVIYDFLGYVRDENLLRPEEISLIVGGIFTPLIVYLDIKVIKKIEEVF